ncbi:MAG: hypothetical protein J07HN4v3_01463 [Halonotius sp. J07HN4]|nr:MAG: hypothetical protein J07HN4v3_01463 [Halonotius sp. J07HN4]
MSNLADDKLINKATRAALLERLNRHIDRVTARRLTTYTSTTTNDGWDSVRRLSEHRRW